ncbi:Putative 4,5-dihydroxyphthalate dehydrogenase [Pontiella desulfatans]|uniref:4,5-dihydroxyphthalate dehydrogenase n=1 Tax=Pontiella desulfatans TaxID=2750659 RepID=A0A6C2TV72_PONDE|nr:Gfo/Idh/MocA family oxidoreductase [Pontiella desulfatans]VGO11505.1 Putative 4,5-dihydroxyphthalate dehydrogenase [Pontiella desulfatans]
MIRVGIMGMGYMGGVHLRNWQAREDAKVVAVCDINPAFGATQGNIETGGDGLNLDGVAVYRSAAEMLAAETLDAVTVALPTHLHKAATIQSLAAGLHVLCEKPMALSVQDCDEMIAAAKTAGKELMIAHCIRFWPEYAWLKSAVESEAFGAVKAADFSRLASAPAWSADSWFANPAKSGGMALDLHIHDLDFIQYLFGAPAAIESEHAALANGQPGHVVSRMDYGAGKVVTATASWMMPPSFGFRMGFRVVFENAAAVLDGDGLMVYPPEGDAYAPERHVGNGYQREIEYFAARVAGPAGKDVITPEQARESVRLTLETMK